MKTAQGTSSEKTKFQTCQKHKTHKKNKRKRVRVRMDGSLEKNTGGRKKKKRRAGQMLSPSTNDNSIVTPLRGTFEVGQRVVRNVPVENVLPSSPSEFLRTPEMERAVGTVIETDEAAVLLKWEVGESHADEWVFKEELEPEAVFAPAVENHDEVVYDETFGAIAKEVLDSWDVQDEGEWMHRRRVADACPATPAQ